MFILDFQSIWYIYLFLSALSYSDKHLTVAGDVFYARWEDVLVGATAVVSTIGGFGNEEQMKRINGEANTIAVDASKEFGEFSVMTDDSDMLVSMYLWTFYGCDRGLR